VSIGNLDFEQAVNALWNGSDLNATFMALWPSTAVSTNFAVLVDQEASPNQPFPYCVYEVSPPKDDVRMFGGTGLIKKVKNTELKFNVHAKIASGDGRSAKEIAGTLAEEIKKIFGGHPTVAPQALSLTHGGHILTQFLTDYGVRTGDEEYQWIVTYNIKTDVPETIA
jgi:hypothetical protein